MILLTYSTEDELCTAVHSFTSWFDRAQFAATYSTGGELCNALHSFTSWRDLATSLKAEKDAEDNAAVILPTVEDELATAVASCSLGRCSASTRSSTVQRVGQFFGHTELRAAATRKPYPPVVLSPQGGAS